MLNGIAKLTGATVLILPSWLFPGLAGAQDLKEHTHVIMDGRILDTPCSIAPDSRDQTISVGSTPVGVIARQGQGQSVPFHIHLKDCVLRRTDTRLPDWNKFAITFDGEADGDNFAVSGDARGVALQVTDKKGNVARPGEALEAGMLNEGDQELHFALRVVSNNKPLRKGTFWSVVHFRINYF
ncbi:fimbrial protein [Pantoea sp. BAV 3049]|uniref:fimbrial protein n=1 Tax=Pantoea sp. BAV 3049 TaxID=2654188 RepID=UPI00131DC439|nr:fimbrial protein [Pantoea sp. BAV 3049]